MKGEIFLSSARGKEREREREREIGEERRASGNFYQIASWVPIISSCTNHPVFIPKLKKKERKGRKRKKKEKKEREKRKREKKERKEREKKREKKEKRKRKNLEMGHIEEAINIELLCNPQHHHFLRLVLLSIEQKRK